MIIKQKFIKREDLQHNYEWMYLFGDNAIRKGMGGQAAEMRGEPNAVGIATKKQPSNDPLAFFYDDQYMDNMKIIYNDFLPVFKHIYGGGTLVIPMDGLGTGLSAMEIHCPRTLNTLNDMLDYLYILDKRMNQ